MMGEGYTAVIGLEVHVQLQTASKIFSSDATTFGAAPNSQVSAITLGHPGTLPRLNAKAVEMAIRMGLACQSTIAETMHFDRKNYFYPDLPKGYQITQDQAPICIGGHITIGDDHAEQRVPLNRIHLEEDAGKSLHVKGAGHSSIDLNRAGVPLIEVVTEPAMRTADEAHALLTAIRKTVRFLDICDGNMEEGSLRCDANVSIMPSGSDVLGTKVEIKNLNSIRNVKRAITGEIIRQQKLVSSGGRVVSDTRLYDAEKNITSSMRTKEELNDYRYFPDPDLCPVTISQEWLASIKKTQPELPGDREKRLSVDYGLPAYDAGVLTETKEMADYFEAVCQHTGHFKAVSNWLMGPVKNILNEKGINIVELKVQPAITGAIVDMINNGKISFTVAAKQLWPEVLKNGNESVIELAKRLHLSQEQTVDALEPTIDDIIKDFPLKVEEYKMGKKAIVKMFMGELMRRTKGRADPGIGNKLIIKKLEQVN